MSIAIAIACLASAVLLLAYMAAGAPLIPDDEPRCDICDYHDHLSILDPWYESHLPPPHDCRRERPKADAALSSGAA